jgi:hypothetical protein
VSLRGVSALSRHTAIAVLSVVMALGLELSKPFAVSSAFTQLRQWRIITAASHTLVGLLAVAFSLQSELTFMSMTRGDLVAGRASVRDAAQRSEARYDAALAALNDLKLVSNKQRDIDANTELRKQRQDELQAAEHDRQAAPVVSSPDPGATALSVYAASLGLKLDPAVLGLWLPLIGVLALEAGAAFSVVLVRSVNSTHASTVTHQQCEQVTQAANTGETALSAADAPVTQKQTRAGKDRKAKRRKDDDNDGPGSPRRGLPALLNHVRANGGVVELSQRRLARKVGVGLGTLQRAMRELSDAGMLVLDTSRAGTRLALAG